MIPALQPGDRIAIISTARKISSQELAPAIHTFESWGLQVVLGQSIDASYNQFAGDDALRLQDFQQMLDDDSIKAIVCARGGYGTTRIIDQVDFTKFKKQPKWVIGFSDVTTIHSHIHNLGIETIHAIMPVLFGREGTIDSVETLRKVLFGENLNYTSAPHAFNRTGTANGQLVGGNLSMLHTLTGTKSDINTEGKILFLEDLDEYLYHIDRMMVHLDRSGKLSNLAGLIVGDVVMGRECSVWFNAVIRGDVNAIRIGDKTNIQDGAVIHCTYQKAATTIGNNVSIGHNAIVHGCTVHDNVLIGMGSIVMDNAVVNENCIVAAGAIVLENTLCESGWIYAGIPAKKVKQLSLEQIAGLDKVANNYVMYSGWFTGKE